MNRARVLFHSVVMIGLTATCAIAQDHPNDRQFMFSISALPSTGPHLTMHIDSGIGERTFDVTDSDRPEQRFGVQASLTDRLSFLGRVGLSADNRDLRSSQQGELLYSVMQSRRSQGSVALGLGMRHESGGVNVLLGRVVAGRTFRDAWRVDGNALFEKPYSVERDAVDLITSVGVSRQIHSSVYAGIELIGEDLEGFWEPDEAEGGARLLVGPSVRIAPSDKKWQVGIAGGPVIRATQSDRFSEASRGLPASTSSNGYVVRASLSYAF